MKTSTTDQLIKERLRTFEEMPRLIFTIKRVKRNTAQTATIARDRRDPSLERSINKTKAALQKDLNPSRFEVPDILKVGVMAATRSQYEDPSYDELTELNALGLLDPQVEPPLDVLERETAMRETIDDRDLWIGDVLQIILRINGKCFAEAFHRMMDIDLNLALYLIKFLKLKPCEAMAEIKTNHFALLNRHRNRVIDSDQVLRCRGVSNNDVLDLIRLNPDLVGLDIKPHIVKSEQQLCYNPYGGFRVEFANEYIAHYLTCPKGQSQSLLKRESWAEV